LHEDVINEYLRICGYKSEDLVPTRKQQRALRKCEIDEDFDDNDYMEIEELTHDEFDTVDLLIKKGEADKCHKQRGEGPLEHERLPVREIVKGEVVVADETVAPVLTFTVGETVAEEEVDRGSKAAVEHVLEEDVHAVLGSDRAGAQHSESNLRSCSVVC